MFERATIPNVIWTLWLQGWRVAPPVAQACLASWRRLNPGWRVRALDRQSLEAFLPAEAISRITANDKPDAAFSDQIRIELLQRYGGVWADATAMCRRPLNDWLFDAMPNGFFAFDRPAPDRMIASWFLASEKGGYIARKWRDATQEYWAERHEWHDYFWFHQLFAQEYESDRHFRRLWDATPRLSAVHDGHFGPEDGRLKQHVTGEIELLSRPPAAVFKLTHKISGAEEPNTLFSRIIDSAISPGASGERPPHLSILVGWYGSFAGHGTIGDLRSLESVTSHLVARGHSVSHATASPFEIAGAARTDWRSHQANEFDVVLFVCGPILKGHPETAAFFERFRDSRLAGLGVSLLPLGDAQRLNPFAFVLGREGEIETHGDVAIIAPHLVCRRDISHQVTIGIALRGQQFEYGVENCAWQETEAVALDLARRALSARDGKIIRIENHLTRSSIAPDEIERQYAACDLVITSRFHGGIEALRNETPFIAIDQIRGGAKVKSLLSRLRWPHVYTIDELNADHLAKVCETLIEGEGDEQLLVAQQVACRHANQTLTHLDAWLASLDGY